MGVPTAIWHKFGHDDGTMLIVRGSEVTAVGMIRSVKHDSRLQSKI